MNLRPPAPKAGALPNCATARDVTKGTAEERPLSAHRAGDGNRTRAICLEGRGSTIELHPRTPEGDTKILAGIVHVRDI